MEVCARLPNRIPSLPWQQLYWFSSIRLDTVTSSSCSLPHRLQHSVLLKNLKQKLQKSDLKNSGQCKVSRKLNIYGGNCQQFSAYLKCAYSRWQRRFLKPERRRGTKLPRSQFLHCPAVLSALSTLSTLATPSHLHSRMWIDAHCFGLITGL